MSRGAAVHQEVAAPATLDLPVAQDPSPVVVSNGSAAAASVPRIAIRTTEVAIVGLGSYGLCVLST